LQVSADRLLAALVAVLPGRQAAAIVADVCGLARNDVYRRMLQLNVEGTGEGD
jgi:hypothetical protein